VVKQEAEQLLSEIREAVAQQTDAIEKLRSHLNTRLERVHDFVNFYRVTQDTWGDYWPHIAAVRKQFLAEEIRIVEDILEKGVATGELMCDNTHLAAQVLVVALASTEYQWSMDEHEIPLEDLVDTMLGMLTEGIRRR